MRYLSLVLFALWILAEVLSAGAADDGTAGDAGAKSVAERIVDAALHRAEQSVRYDPAYVAIDYPGGDVPADTGVCTDVVVRAYRALGVDLQRLVHEDMAENFGAYPPLWGLDRPDPNIDHRRVPNLQRYFERRGAAVPESDDRRFLPGDLVAWDLTGEGLWHIGIVVGPDRFVHNIGAGPVVAEGIDRWEVIGHYRFRPGGE